MSGFNLYRAQAEAVIEQAGERVTVLRGNAGSPDRFGSEVISFSSVGVETAVFFYQGTRGREADNVSGGWVREERARLMFRRAASITEDDRVQVPSTGTTYRVVAVVSYPTHKEASLRALTDHE